MKGFSNEALDICRWGLRLRCSSSPSLNLHQPFEVQVPQIGPITCCQEFSDVSNRLTKLALMRSIGCSDRENGIK